MCFYLFYAKTNTFLKQNESETLEQEDSVTKKSKIEVPDGELKAKKESAEARNAIAATRRIVAKIEKAKQSLGKKKKDKYNSGKKNTKQLGGVLKRAIKAANLKTDRK